MPMEIDPTRVKVAPSLLASDFADLRGELDRLAAGGADWVHLDIMDGHFVPNLTFGPPVVARLRERTPLPLDTHLMIAEPGRYIDDFVKAGADLITVHAEATAHLHRVLGQIAEHNVRVGVAINPHTPVEAIQNVLEMVDLVLVMSVNPGFGGQRYLPLVEPKIRRLRELLAGCGRAGQVEIEVDGGVDPRTAPLCLAAGATVLVAGSAVFGAPDVRAAISALRPGGR